MQIRTLYILFFSLSIFLLSLLLYLYAGSIEGKRLEIIRLSKIQKNCMKEYPRRKKVHIRERTSVEGQVEINRLLSVNPLQFESNSSMIYTTRENRVTIARIVKVVNHISEDIALSISAHTDSVGSKQHNLKLSQQRADMLKEHILRRSQILLITSIGYGEEFPLSKSSKPSKNRRIEITIKRVGHE